MITKGVVIVFFLCAIIAFPVGILIHSTMTGLSAQLAFMVLGWMAGAIIVGADQYWRGVERGRRENRTGRN